MWRSYLGSGMGLFLVLPPPPAILHGTDPHLARKGLQLLLWLLVLGHMAKCRMEMMRTLLLLHPILALPSRVREEGTSWERGQELVMFLGCLGWKSDLDWLVPISIQVGNSFLCGAAGSKAQSFSVLLDGVTCPSWPSHPLGPWQTPVMTPCLSPSPPPLHPYPEVPEMSHTQTGCHVRVAEKLGSFEGQRRQLSLLSPGQQAGGGPSPPASPGPCLLAHACVHLFAALPESSKPESSLLFLSRLF